MRSERGKDREYLPYLSVGSEGLAPALTRVYTARDYFFCCNPAMIGRGAHFHCYMAPRIERWRRDSNYHSPWTSAGEIAEVAPSPREVFSRGRPSYPPFICRHRRRHLLLHSSVPPAPDLRRRSRR